MDINIEQYPFLSIASYGTGSNRMEYIGIIQNFNKQTISMYVMTYIKDREMLIKFLNYGEEWWYQSNRQIPINTFLKNDFDLFSFCLKSFNNKSFKIIKGQQIQYSMMMKRRIRKKQMQIVKVTK